MVKISLADLCQLLNSACGVASNSTVLCMICNTCKIEVISAEKTGKGHLLSTESIIFQENSTSFTGRKSLKCVSKDESFSPVTAHYSAVHLNFKGIYQNTGSSYKPAILHHNTSIKYVFIPLN